MRGGAGGYYDRTRQQYVMQHWIAIPKAIAARMSRRWGTRQQNVAIDEIESTHITRTRVMVRHRANDTRRHFHLKDIPIGF